MEHTFISVQDRHERFIFIGNISTINWMWQNFHNLLDVAKFPQFTGCGNISTIYWMWQNFHNLLDVSEYLQVTGCLLL